jgi:hypothetical protein
LLAADGGGGTCDCAVDLKRWWHEFEGSLRLRMRDDCRAAEVVEERMAIMIGRLLGCFVFCMEFCGISCSCCNR